MIDDDSASSGASANRGLPHARRARALLDREISVYRRAARIMAGMTCIDISARLMAGTFRAALVTAGK